MNRFAAALIGTVLASPASAQLGSPFGNGAADPMPSQAAAMSAAWAAIPKDQMTCLQAALRRSNQPDIPELIARNLGPSAPPAANHLLRCKIDREETASAEKAIIPFVRWLEEQIAAKPELAAAMDRCAATLSAYQGQLLIRLRAQAGASSSRSQQETQLSVIEQLSADQARSIRVGCVKSFLAHVNVAGSSGYFADELSLLGGRLTQSNFDLTAKVQAKLNDLTEAGTKQLLAAISFENIPANDLRAEIQMAATQPKGIDYLACFLPNDWVSWFSSNSYCHKPLLERSLIGAIQVATIQKR
jgi:hypothetical protein